jgi:hypothetical protein
MQKTTIIATILFLFTTPLVAGELSSMGIKLGYNSSIFTGNDIPGKGVRSQNGAAFGGFVCYKFNQRFSLQQEIILTSKGAKINTVGDVYLSNIFFYFEMPLLLKISFQTERIVRPNVFLGPAIGIYLLGVNDVAIIDDIRSIDAGIVLGVGIEFRKINLDIRINEGFFNFDQSADDIDLKNRTISFMVSYIF